MAKPEAEEERNTLSTKRPNIDTTRSLIDVYALYYHVYGERTNLVYFTSVDAEHSLLCPIVCVNPYTVY